MPRMQHDAAFKRVTAATKPKPMPKSLQKEFLQRAKKYREAKARSQDTIYLKDDNGNDTNQHIAYRVEATEEMVNKVLNAPRDTNNGRGKAYFVRMQNGDLMLAIYPCGDLYCSIESEIMI